MAVTHLFVSSKPDSTDSTLVNASNWNANHVISSGAISSGMVGQGAIGNGNIASGIKDVTISPQGPFDGGDYGPNTPGTTTCGFQEAMGQVAASGGRVRIIKGLYSGIQGDITISGQNVHLDFDQGSTLYMNSGAGTNGLLFYNPSNLVGGQGGPIRITGFPILGGYNSGSAALRIRNATSQNSDSNAIGHTYVEATVISGGWANGVIIEGTTYYADLHLNIVTYIGQNAVLFQKDPVNNNQPNNNKIYMSCSISGIGTSIPTGLNIQAGNGNLVLHYDGCYYQSGIGIQVTTVQNKFFGPRFEANGTDIVFNSGSNNNIVEFPTFTGTPAVSGFNSGNTYNQITYVPGQGLAGGALPRVDATTPLSGVYYQNKNLFPIVLNVPVTFLGCSGAAVTFTPYLNIVSGGGSLAGWLVPANTPNGTQISYNMTVPAGWYYKFDFNTGGASGQFSTMQVERLF